MNVSTMNIFDRIEIVAAIDFGTTYSGYAYSYAHAKKTIHLNGAWANNAFKTPTIILFDANQNFKAFGRHAEKFICDNPEYDGYYFQRFKMKLNNEKISREMILRSEDGKEMKALQVFSEAIRYFKDHFLDSINKRCPSNMVDVAQVRWVLTVPAIWSHASKQFMREAGEKAGIPKINLSIALEPECASIYCQHKDVADFQTTIKNEPGTKYLVLDNGGGTVDASVHQILQNGKLRSLHMPSGGAWGGSNVNEGFEKYLESIFSSAVIQKVKTLHPDHWLKMRREFEDIKTSLDECVQNFYSMSLANAFIKIYKEETHNDIDQRITYLNDSRGFYFNCSGGAHIQGGETLKIPRGVITDLIKEMSTKIKRHTEKLLKNEEIRGLDFVNMVGGFSNSSIVRDDIQSLISDIHWPEYSELAVLRGAVIAGWNPDLISSRRSLQTYGIQTNRDFVKEKHPERLKYKNKDGVWKCGSIFDTLVTVNEEVDVGQVGKVSKTYHPLLRNQNKVTFPIYTSSKNKVSYCDEEGCRKVGKITVDSPNVEKGINRDIKVDIIFGNTEFFVDVLDVSSANRRHATFDFLSTQ
ncbi:heat shock 70 kDa protein 12A-like [Hydractinia symbiolongicarpus]|uniref:heat shock 70 kDa protein 12A-like n=1 Tax=Hydractinia symbiolongicarpus TaxID=13093 RepID=UPI00254EC2F6|nr:heat shock 70 kDa protein 12A-like [Hydractinia symbiolongicarpus]